jgi:uncharacterized membrane protein YccC
MAKNEQQQPPAHQNIFKPLSWEAYEYEHHERTSDWYWALAILTIGLFCVSLIMHSYLFGLFIVLAGFTVAMYGVKEPRKVTFTLTHEGLQIQNRIYLYNSLKSFWIFYTPNVNKELSIESEKMFMPHIKIPLGDADPIEVRSHLLKFLPEKRQEELLADLFAKYLRF